METPSIFQKSINSRSSFDQIHIIRDCSEINPPIYDHKKSLSKKSAKYIIDHKEKFSEENKGNQAKHQKWRAIVPYIDDSSSQVNTEWDREFESIHLETIREDPADSLAKIFNRNKVSKNSQKSRKGLARIAKCKNCKVLSYFESGICSSCSQQYKESSNLRSLIFGSCLCCCNFLTD